MPVDCRLRSVSRLAGDGWVGEQDDEFLSSLIEDVLSAGNFGKKEAGRRTALAMEKTSFAEITRDRYPQATGLLLPVYMVVNVVRYGWLLFTGKKQVIRLSTFAGTKERNKLYGQFRLFEV